MEKKLMTYPMAMKDFFGLLPGTTLKDFLAEMKTLDEKDKAFFKAGLEQNGYTIKEA